MVPAGASQRGQIREVLRSAVHAALSRLELPSVAVGSMTVERGTLLAHISGEELPRLVEGIQAVRREGEGVYCLWGWETPHLGQALCQALGMDQSFPPAVPPQPDDMLSPGSATL